MFSALCLRLMLGIPLPLSSRKFSVILGKEIFIPSWLMRSSHSKLWIAIFWAVHWVGSDFQLGSEGSSWRFIGKSGTASSLPQDLALLQPKTGIAQGCTSEWCLLLHFTTLVPPRGEAQRRHSTVICRHLYCNSYNTETLLSAATLFPM